MTWRSTAERRSLIAPPVRVLLLATARPSIAAEERAVLAGSVPRLTAADWTVLIQQALAHGTASLLCRHLLGMAPDLLPADIATASRAYLDGRATATAEGIAELTAVLDALAAAGVPALPFKGPALGLQAYGDPVLRAFRDLDLLIRPAHIEPALAVLRDLGYRSAVTGLRPRRLQDFQRSLTPCPAPDARLFLLDDAGLLFIEERQEIHALNTSATAIWCLMEEGLDAAGMVAALQAAAGLGAQDAAAFVAAALADWTARGFLADTAAPPRDAPAPVPRAPRDLPPYQDPAFVAARHYALGPLCITVRFTASEQEAVVHPLLAHLEADACAQATVIAVAAAPAGGDVSRCIETASHVPGARDSTSWRRS